MYIHTHTHTMFMYNVHMYVTVLCTHADVYSTGHCGVVLSV